MTVTPFEYAVSLRRVRAGLLEIKCELAALRFWLGLRRLAALAAKAGFNPGQLRVPAGQPGGGQWSGDGSGGTVTQVGARGRIFVPTRIHGRLLQATPGQSIRYAIASARAEASIARVRRLDPTWSPRPSFSDPNNIESQIRRSEFNRREAENRLVELTRARFGDNQGPPLDAPRSGGGTSPSSVSPTEAIRTYRSLIGMPDTANDIAANKADGTVAYAEVDGEPVFGVNGNSPGYTVSDEMAARALRGRLSELYPNVMSTHHLGRFPNDALFHAEANALIRAANMNGGSLAGRSIEMRVDRELCFRCERVLPLIG